MGRTCGEPTEINMAAADPLSHCSLSTTTGAARHNVPAPCRERPQGGAAGAPTLAVLRRRTARRVPPNNQPTRRGCFRRWYSSARVLNKRLCSCRRAPGRAPHITTFTSTSTTITSTTATATAPMCAVQCHNQASVAAVLAMRRSNPRRNDSGGYDTINVPGMLTLLPHVPARVA